LNEYINDREVTLDRKMRVAQAFFRRTVSYENKNSFSFENGSNNLIKSSELNEISDFSIDEL
jgi:hypothetical protein